MNRIERLNDIADRMNRGEITPAQARAEAGLPPNPADSPGFRPRPREAMAVSALENEGLSTAQARERVTTQGADAFSTLIEQQQAAEQAAYDRRQAIIAANHPDEKRRAAAASMAQRDRIAQDAVLAREHLVNAEILPESEVDLLSDIEAVGYAFGEQKDLANDYAANAAAAMGGGQE